MLRDLYSPFRATTSLAVMVAMEGSADTVAPGRDALEDYAKLRLRNDLSVLPIWRPGSEVDPNTAFVMVRVWTVGREYPIAYYISIAAGPLSHIDLYETAILGYCSRQLLEAKVRGAFDSIIKDFAVAVYKGRGEM